MLFFSAHIGRPSRNTPSRLGRPACGSLSYGAPLLKTPASVSLRSLTTEDIDTLLHIRTHTRENPLTLEELRDAGITQMTLRRYLTTTHRGWMAVVKEVPCGFVIVDEKFGEVWVIALLPEYEGQGIGRRLLAEASQRLFACGHRTILLETSPDMSHRAHRLYAAAGWQIIQKNEDSLVYCRRKEANS